MLRDATELRGTLAAEMRGMRRGDVAAWLSGTWEDQRDEMSAAELRTCCDAAERRHHLHRDEPGGGGGGGDGGRGGDGGFVWTLPTAQRARLHNALLGGVRARGVLRLEAALRAYRQLMLAVRHVEERESLDVLRGAAWALPRRAPPSTRASCGSWARACCSWRRRPRCSRPT